MLCYELRSVFLLDILEHLRPWSTLAQQGGQLVFFRQGYCSSQEKTGCICLVMFQNVALQGKTSTQAWNIFIGGSVAKQNFAKCAYHEMIANKFVSGYPSARRGLLFLPWRLTDSACGGKLTEVIGWVKWKRVKSYSKEFGVCTWRKDCVHLWNHSVAVMWQGHWYMEYMWALHSSRDEVDPRVQFWADLHSYNFITVSLEAEWVDVQPVRCPCLQNTQNPVVCP